MRIRILVMFTVALVAGACAEKISTRDDAGSSDSAAPAHDGGFPAASGAFVHSVEGGVITTTADATATDAWQHLDLDTGLSTTDDAAWDLAFSRFRIRTNGGVSGTGGVQVAALAGRAFDSVTMAPEEGWSTDRPDGDGDDDAEPDNAFNNGVDDWYAYDEETHTLTPKDVTYVVASTAGRFYALRIDSYYDAAGSPAVLRFRWRAIAPPASALPDAGTTPVLDGGVTTDGGAEPLPEGAVVVDASDPSAWVYLDARGAVVTPADPANDSGWDLALRRTEVRTNSGSSGAGLGGTRASEGDTTFDAITDATTFGYAIDEVVAGPPGTDPSSANPVLAGWYDYDVATHTVIPGERAYLVRTALGGYAKLRIWRWRDGRFALSIAEVPRRVDTLELDVDASDDAAWTHVSLRDGGPVEVPDPASDDRWDIAFSRDRIRTNGGTSGAGAGAAIETAAAEIDDLDEIPADDWLEDTTLSGGAPGSPSYSGNGALAGWYDYDVATHTLSPKPVVFLIRTADGQLAALRIRSYASGVYHVAIAFAGPGQTSF